MHFLSKTLELAAVLLGRGLICSYAELRIRITLERIQIPLFTFFWIRILIKVIRIPDRWSTDPLRLHCERPRPAMAPFFEALKPLKFD